MAADVVSGKDTHLRPTRTFEQFFRHVKGLGFDPALCVDVGAANGTGVIYEAFPRALHVVFEPLPDFHEALAKRLERFRHEIHHCALMAQDGEMEILRTEHNLYGSSLMHLRSNTNDPRLLRVPVRRLDDVLADHRIDGPVLLKTDCQGSDLMVVEGAPKTLEKCDIVILECSMFRFWGDHQPILSDVVLHMAERGFVIYDILDGIFRPSDNALGQLDVVFAKTDGFLRASRKW
jgi:FkbM family methyltransferase